MSSNRIQKVKDEFGLDIEKMVKSQNKKNDLTIDNIWDIIIQADPTQNKKNIRWLAKSFLNKGFLWEDIRSGEKSKVFDTLNLFEKNRNKLDIENRNIDKVKTLGSLYNVVKQFDGVLSRKEEKKGDKERAYEDSHILYDKDGLKIISPRTVFASKWFGKGTRWCTAADEDNMFEEYNDKGPLIIIITPDGRKFQAHRDFIDSENDNDEYDDTAVFMDENDDEISEYDINYYWDYIKPVSMYLGSDIFINENDVGGHDILLSKIIANPIFLDNALLNDNERDSIDEDSILEIAEKNPLILSHLYYLDDNSLDDNEEAINAISSLRQNDKIIKKTLELFPYMAVSILSEQKEENKKEYIKEILFEVCKKNNNYNYLLDEQKTKNICEDLLKKNKISLSGIPKNIQTQEMVNMYVNSGNFYQISEIRKDLIDKNILEKSCLKDMNIPNYYNFKSYKHNKDIFLKYNNSKIFQEFTIKSGEAELFNTLPSKIKTKNNINLFLENKYVFFNEEFFMENKDILDEKTLFKCIEKDINSFNMMTKEQKENQNVIDVRNIFSGNPIECDFKNKDVLKIFLLRGRYAPQEKIPKSIIGEVAKVNLNVLTDVIKKEYSFKDNKDNTKWIFDSMIKADGKYNNMLFRALENKVIDASKIKISKEFIMDFINNSKNYSDEINIIYIPFEYQDDDIKKAMIEKDEFNKVFIDGYTDDESLNIIVDKIIENPNYISYIPPYYEGEEFYDKYEEIISKKNIDFNEFNFDESKYEFLLGYESNFIKKVLLEKEHEFSSAIYDEKKVFDVIESYIKEYKPIIKNEKTIKKKKNNELSL